MQIAFTREECLNLESSLKCEWLETNGLGGYSSSTIIDCHTRKYHGLLVAPLPKHNAKFVLLSRLDPVIAVQGNTFQLSTNKYPDVFHPTGHKYICRFEQGLFPKTTYHIGDILLERSVMMPINENTIIFEYKLISADNPITFLLHPKLAYRNSHELTRENMYLRVKTYAKNGVYKMDPYAGMPPLFIDTSITSEFYPGPYWNYNLEYLKERSRGFSYQEDLFCPGVIELTLKRGDTLYVRASLDLPQKPVTKIWKTEWERRKKIFAGIADKDFFVRHLKFRGSQFVIQSANRKLSIIAGYHWFNEWGRDAMISVPGLTWHCGKRALGCEILKTFASYEKDGLIPNFISVNGKDVAANSVDASLWFCWAVQDYLKTTSDHASVKKSFFPVIKKILTQFASNTLAHVALHDNGLIWVGNPQTQLTWMDAKIHGQPVTSRYGYAVELNALWFNALSFYQELCAHYETPFDSVLEKARENLTKNFSEIFWCQDQNCLADVVNEHGQDKSIRPNQIFAASLPYSPLDLTQKRKIVGCVEKNLLTSCGLRTLSPHDAKYKSVYHGTPDERDAAYHQGTVWPWLIGHFTEASLHCSKDPQTTRRQLLDGYNHFIKQHLRTACIGGVSEIFNGDPPHTAKGCIHQAWSVAEVIRGWGMLTGMRGQGSGIRLEKKKAVKKTTKSSRRKK